MKINKNTITFEKKDSILFNGKIISNGHFAVDLEKIFCFKFKFPDDKLTAAFINKQQFTKEGSSIKVGDDCTWMPNLEAAFTNTNPQYEGFITDFRYQKAILIINPQTEKRAWVDSQYLELLTNQEIIISDEHSPIYTANKSICVMPIRVSLDIDTNKMLDEVVKVICNYEANK